jgi:hypothetical protein
MFNEKSGSVDEEFTCRQHEFRGFSQASSGLKTLEARRGKRVFFDNYT